MLDSHVVEFCTLFIITTTNDDDVKSCIAKPKPFCFLFSFDFMACILSFCMCSFCNKFDKSDKFGVAYYIDLYNF